MLEISEEVEIATRLSGKPLVQFNIDTNQEIIKKNQLPYKKIVVENINESSEYKASLGSEYGSEVEAIPLVVESLDNLGRRIPSRVEEKEEVEVKEPAIEKVESPAVSKESEKEKEKQSDQDIPPDVTTPMKKKSAINLKDLNLDYFTQQSKLLQIKKKIKLKFEPPELVVDIKKSDGTIIRTLKIKVGSETEVLDIKVDAEK
jgi:hypothetical protein